MKKQVSKLGAFTLIELGVVIAVLGLLVVLLIPAQATSRANASRFQCLNNLKRIGIAFRTWASPYQDRFPMAVPNNEGGPPHKGPSAPAVAAPFTGANSGVATFMYEVFMVMSNELNTPKIVVCPGDERSAATNFGQFRAASIANNSSANQFVSYFVGRDASETQPAAFLSGDRNVFNPATSVQATFPYGLSPATGTDGRVEALGTNMALNIGFTDKMHKKAGNVGLSDGSVQQYGSARLRQQLPLTGDPLNVLWFP